MNKAALIERIRKHKDVGDDRVFGVVASYGKVVNIDDEGDKNDIIAIANTGDIDLDDEVVVPGGGATTYLDRNNQVFVDHNYGVHDAAGFIRSKKLVDGAWRVRIGLYDNDAGRAVKEIARKSGQIGLSIGFFPVEYGPPTDEEREKYAASGKVPASIVRRWDWFELSFTALPCNVSCQGSFVAGDDRKMVDTLGELVDSGAVEKRVAVLLGYETRKTVVFREGSDPMIVSSCV